MNNGKKIVNGLAVRVIRMDATLPSIPAMWAPRNALAPWIEDRLTQYLASWFPGQTITISESKVYTQHPGDQPVQVATYTVLPNSIDETGLRS